jgi:hypothetical protein
MSDRRRDRSGVQPVIPPKTLPGFPDAKRAKAKTPRPGGLRKRWKDRDGTIYEWVTSGTPGMASWKCTIAAAAMNEP